MIWQKALMQELEKEQVYRYQRDYGPRYDITCAWICLPAADPIPRESWVPIHLLFLGCMLSSDSASTQRVAIALWFSIFLSGKTMKIINPEAGYG